jgi:thymidylate synthase (FAD)
MNVELVWHTPDAETAMAYCARVSSTRQAANPRPDQFIRSAIRDGHWSVLSMANMCVSITTSLPIATQIIRHWSMHNGGEWDGVQQQSRRYDSRIAFEPPLPARQQPASRRDVVDTIIDDEEVQAWWRAACGTSDVGSVGLYNEALKRGISREQARRFLNEGTQTTLCVNGTIRSWYHYIQQRLSMHAQEEHRQVAEQVLVILRTVAPTVAQCITERPAPTTGDIDRVIDTLRNAANTEGGHHKQYFITHALKLLGVDVSDDVDGGVAP